MKLLITFALFLASASAQQGILSRRAQDRPEGALLLLSDKAGSEESNLVLESNVPEDREKRSADPSG
eukprot:maker-scaffold483_size159862-snap-gene-0.29 protein:Tk08688 transcript:maker-scaffold483_size159862-snap-gene-0.29-mRNA-1 annotation:"beta-lactamase induction signal transducer"